MQQTLHLIQSEAAEARVIVRIDLAPGLPPILGNRIQIAQVIVNLLRNAIEALAPEPGPDRHIILSARRDGAEVRIAVEDNGPGISPDIALFSQFETSKAGGMGLGLSICRSILVANGGALWHEVPQSRGARFVFTLPVDKTAHGTEA